MKKTTLVIMGLSVCVVILATALGIVLTQEKTETIVMFDKDSYSSISKIFMEYDKVETLNDFKKLAPMGIKKVDSAVKVGLCYRPLDSGKLEEHISQDLSPKIKKFFDLFKNSESIQKLICFVRIPDKRYKDWKNIFKNKAWAIVLSFEFDKDTYKNINWKKFEATELFKYAQNIQWHDITT